MIGAVQSAPLRGPDSDDPGTLDLSRFAASLGPDAERMRCVRELHAWLAQLDPQADLAPLTRALRFWPRWIRARGAVPSSYALLPVGGSAGRRFHLLLDALEGAPTLAHRFSASISRVLAGSDALRLFEVGLPNQRGLLAELADRLAR